MSKLLSIVIPTYNRSKMLDDQLSWLAQDLKGLESECNVVVNDNCSTDDTPQILARWKDTFEALHIDVTINRHDHNIGGMANIVASIQSANGEFVWTLGDDDAIQKGTVPYITGLLKKYEGLSLIMLDGIGRDKKSMQIKHECFFDSTTDKPISGVSEFEHFLEHCMAGVLFISNAIYKTSLAKEALTTWPHSEDNLAAQAYWVAYCAARGKFIVTPLRLTEAAMGIGFTDKDMHWSFKMRFTSVPEVYLRLMNAGYSRAFCLQRIYSNFFSIVSYRMLGGGIRQWFKFSITEFGLYLNLAFRALIVAVSGGLPRGGRGRQALAL